MKKAKRTPAGDALTSLILDLFQLNGALLYEGDRLVSGLGLTSARWQILGAVANSEHPLPVAWLARNLGASRQNVQRIVNDLQKKNLVELQENPHHQRAHLVVLTDKGRQAFDAAMRLQAPWVNNLSDGLTVEDIEAVHRVIMILHQKLNGKIKE